MSLLPIDFTKHKALRVFIIAFSCIGLALVFLFQRINYTDLLNLELSNHWTFIVNRTFRFLINDNLVLLLIYGIFYDKQYVKLGLLVEAFGFACLLIPYFILRFQFDLDYMYISFIHRLIINPTLMLLLIPAIFYQRSGKQRS